MTRIVGLDLSLTSTGIARVTVYGTPGAETAETTLRRVTSAPPAKTLPRHLELAARSARLRRVAGEVATVCSGADLVVVEGPAYASSTGHMHDRSGLWWLVIARLTANRIPTVEVPAAVLKRYATGKGNAPKDAVLAEVVRRWPSVQVTGNDEADALVLAAMGARAAGCPIDNLPKQHLTAMAAVAWPT